MKTITTKEGVTGFAVTLKKTVEVTATEKSSHKTGSKRMVPEHMVAHLLKKGMIEAPKKPKE